ncbi:MAG: ABC transporter ATP-binding protein [Elusimicrobia bacterium]|nr:ABC transporter ATP-binding protein [Elusimicrobiota bacterium]MDE2426616.1 ABC transporter ATP-binding protein [Elusimicrobiota bacterium]
MAEGKGWRARLREFGSALRNAPRAFALLWEADRRGALGLTGSALVGSIIPVSQAWVTKLIIDGVLSSVRAGRAPAEGLRLVLPYVAAEFVLILLGMANGQLRQLCEKLVDHRLGHLVNTRIMRKALVLEARYFEDPDFYDQMQNARRQSEFRVMALVRSGFLLAQNVLTLLSFATVLLAFSPLVALVLFGAAVPAFLVQCRYSQLEFRLEKWRTPETRSMAYLEQVLTLDTTVKEVKLFGLGEPLLARYAGIFWRVFREDAALARGRSFKSLLWGLLATVAYYGAYVWVILLTLRGRVTLGEMTMYMTLFSQSQGAFQGLLENVGSLYENGLFLQNLFSFFELEPQAALATARPRLVEDPARGIEFRQVSFQYPGRSDWALRDLSLAIGPREKLALVGENGAGKTTLIKLLTRLYEPTQGRILFRGVDLRQFSPEELRLRVGAIFQDYVRYHLPLSENVGLGAVEHMGERARVEEASRKSGADEVAAALPNSYDTMLGRWFDSGHELSGGQWQKIALGRAFMGEREVLILDEPTASLDAKAEFDVFQRFQRLAEGKIVLLVSHRFSTVRMADRIAVLKEGRIEELGSHAELLAGGGTYARLFELQAQGYR